MRSGTIRYVEDDSGCKHRSLDGPSLTYENFRYGWCWECGREVAIELDKNGQRTGLTRLVEHGPSVQSH